LLSQSNKVKTLHPQHGGGAVIRMFGGRVRTKASAVKKAISRTAPAAPRASWLRWLKQERFVLGLLLVVATLVVYFPVGHHPFVNYDDMVYVVNNPHIQSGLDWDTISWAFTTFYQFNWHPLTWLSHAIDVQMFQLEPGGHHAMNLLLQVVNVLLLFWVLLRATGLRRAQRDGGRIVCAAPHQRGIGGLDLGAQEPAQHVVFPAGIGGVSLVCYPRSPMGKSSLEERNQRESPALAAGTLLRCCSRWG
jgi:hypothetical protein